MNYNYYGKAKNELRITRFGNDFPYFEEDHVGDLLIIAKQTDDDYEGFVLSTEDDIDTFMLHFNLAADRPNQLIDVANISNIISENKSLQVAIEEGRAMATDSDIEAISRVFHVKLEDWIK